MPLRLVQNDSGTASGGGGDHGGGTAGQHTGSGHPGRDTRAVPVLKSDDEEQFLWGGLNVELYRDATEAYWSNLVGRQPALFILCSHKEDGMLEPRSVTADMHEAGSSMEGDDQVLSAAIPAEVYHQLERFVVEHHKPEVKRKRKRTDWTGSKED